MKAALLAGIAALFLATGTAQATFFPGPTGSCCNQFGGGGGGAGVRPDPRLRACLGNMIGLAPAQAAARVRHCLGRRAR